MLHRFAPRLCSRAFVRATSTTPIPGDHMKEGFGLPPGGRSHRLTGAFTFECGSTLPSLTLGFHTYGTLAPDGSNAVLVGHSLTSNSAVHEWWGALLGAGPAFALDTERYFVICVNYLGSVYGSTGPLEAAPGGGPPLSADFPVATLKDNVAAQRALLEALGVRRVALAMGGSLGGMLALEWAASAPQIVDALCVVGSCGRHPDWAIGFGEAGRQAIFADPRWEGGFYGKRGAPPPLCGMAAARQLAMLSYRTPQSLSEKFGRALVPGGRPPALAAAQGGGGAPFFDVEGYLNYQGDKFRRRFDPLSYVRLTQLLDSHDLGRGRDHAGGDFKRVLQGLPQRALVVGIDSDLLYPFEHSVELAAHIPDATLHMIRSPHGHDSFLIEIEALNAAIVAWRDGGAPADERTLTLLRHGKWEGGGVAGGPPLHKVFALRDARDAGVFFARLKDLQLHAGEARLPFVAEPAGPASVRVATRKGVAARAPPRRADVEAALAVDKLAAEMQLAGNPKWA